MKTTLIALSVALVPVVCFGSANSAKDVPSWVQEVSTRAIPSYPGIVPAVHLISEQHVVVDASGTVTTTTRSAIKILTLEGQKRAHAAEYYYANGRKVKQLRAWLVAPNGFVKGFDKNAVSDMGAFNEMELYNDIRVRRIKADNPEIGSVFAYESEVEEKALFAQDQFEFQTNLPAVESRYILTLPPGWTQSAVVFNHQPIQPIVDGTTYTWELKQLPYQEQQDHSPSLDGLVPRLAVSFLPPGDAAPTTTSCFRSWGDVSRWATQLANGQDEASPELTAKVHELVAGATTDYAKIQAIGRYVQRIKYVAVEMDSAHGGGYKPHKADLVFRKQYGDCKDKANLMRAMLKAAGIQSYLVTIFSGDRTFVRQEWPSPEQFNHMILAVRAPEGVSGDSVISSPVGRLVVFDPTSEVTPMGNVPWYEQDSYALLCAGNQGTIFKVPATAPESNLMDVTIEAQLNPAGSLDATYSSIRHGQLAENERARQLYSNGNDFQAGLEHSFGRTIKAVSLSDVQVQDAFDENAFRLKLHLASPSYGQMMQGRLFVFNPSVLEPPGPTFARIPSRTSPIVLRAACYRKHVHMKLPPGFTVDEMPEPYKSEAPFARFSLAYRQEANEIILDEELAVQAQTLPAEEYQHVKSFFDKLDGADQQRAVLVKSGS